MSTLSELIEDLYQHSQDAVPDRSLPAETTSSADPEIQARRIYRTLNEMAEVLDWDEQPDTDVAPPTEEICLRILNHWESLSQSILGIHDHMKSLEADIARMQPWGDFDVMKIDALARRGICLQFWSVGIYRLAELTTLPALADFHLRVISQDAHAAYFVTVSTDGLKPPLPAYVQEIEICPCPISTLIMLQTRDKDSLKRIETLRGDYALAHYAELYAALREALPPGSALPQFRAHRPGLRQRLQQLFRRI